MEIIIVDDNSDPQKVDFLKFPGSERDDVNIIYDNYGHGAGAARNVGLTHAKGKWILFADCDDTYTKDLSKFLDNYIDSHFDIIYFKAYVINSFPDTTKLPLMNLYIDNYLNGKGKIEDIKFGAWEPWNKLIRKSIINDYNIRFDEISSSNDKMFSLKLGACTNNIEISSLYIYNYILREGSIIHTRKEKRFKNSWNTIIEQNSLYHRVGYKRMVFIPFFLLSHRKLVTKEILKQYMSYLKQYKANPFEGFFCNFLNRAIKRIFK